jgi:uncharacterized protein YdhG (YjbR/CyaY superfamily)
MARFCQPPPAPRLAAVEENQRVEEYLAGLREPERAALERLRDLIRAAAPDATEAISYQMPAFKDRGRGLVAYAAFKDHCSLFPMSTKVFDVLGGELEPYRSSKGTIRFTVDDPLPDSLVTRVVQARLAENEARRGR